ncbi:MAG TPA: NUDIX hydrolase [Gammaproteobacteria bacterium]|jgi:ADP-ribose pyrophosphatase YjhB (NUDIX family)|nr:NUDIX hydrolase [Chromatiales bacterium]MCP4926960.1 NUDIX hydrolase [Gammaproteobacteria bacterium]MDP7296779.1 NUDIX hydrolase [Gammaproteobacteria bacterium]MDP7660448.1 NUDIX hydrolase [Gammaproteobacteria bacterium]HJP39819.1 NUDIX hydrolase [Gammaproteobacteria bacterium]
MKFCSNCGKPVNIAIPAGDNRERYVCSDCGTIHYQNPRIVAGCVAEFQGKILLCQRAIEPRPGYWTVPAGFMELGETVADAAARETLEEAEAQVEIGALIAVVDVLQAQQVHVFFAGILAAASFAAGDETLDTALFLPADIPWDNIAFPSVRIALEQFLRNSENGRDDFCLRTAPGQSLD